MMDTIMGKAVTVIEGTAVRTQDGPDEVESTPAPPDLLDRLLAARAPSPAETLLARGLVLPTRNVEPCPPMRGRQKPLHSPRPD